MILENVLQNADDIKNHPNNPKIFPQWNPPIGFEQCRTLNIPATRTGSPHLIFHEMGEWLDRVVDVEPLHQLYELQQNTRVATLYCHKFSDLVSFSASYTTLREREKQEFLSKPCVTTGEYTFPSDSPWPSSLALVSSLT